MGLLQNILNTVKRYTLDKTDLDEKAYKATTTLANKSRNFFTQSIQAADKINTVPFLPKIPTPNYVKQVSDRQKKISTYLRDEYIYNPKSNVLFPTLKRNVESAIDVAKAGDEYGKGKIGRQEMLDRTSKIDNIMLGLAIPSGGRSNIIKAQNLANPKIAEKQATKLADIIGRNTEKAVQQRLKKPLKIENSFIGRYGENVPVDTHIEASYRGVKAGDIGDPYDGNLAELMKRGNIRTAITPNEANFEIIGNVTNPQIGQMLRLSKNKTVNIDITDEVGKLVESKTFNNADEMARYLEGKMNRATPQVEDDFIKGLEKDQPKGPIKLDDIMENKNPQYTSPSQLKQQKFKAKVKAEVEPKSFNEMFSRWIGKRDVADTTGVEIGSRVNIPKGVNGFDVIKYIENPTKNASPQIKQAAKEVRAQFDSLFKYAKESGIDIGYMKDYVTHIWEGDPASVAQAYQSASKRFGFSAKRKIPTYEEGIRLGKELEAQGLPNPFIPKYTDPRQIIAEYSRKLEQTKANIEFVKELKDQGLIVAKREAGFVPITAPGFQAPAIRIGKETIREGLYYAPPEVAKVINQVFSPQESPALLSKAAKLSGRIQDIRMAGGGPGTPINAWTAAQMTKEILSGRVVGPLKALWHSLSEGGANKYFKENALYIKEQQANNIPISTSFDIESLAPRTVLQKAFGKNFGDFWNKMMNNPTFKRFMPALQTEFYKDTRAAALQAGKTEQEAIRIAAQATKNFYGLTSTAKTALQSKIGHDVVSVLFFAPKYRQSMFNFWINNIKSLKNPMALENQANAKFLVGSMLAYLAYDKMNMATTGRHMADNPAGKEDKVLIPLGDGYTMGIPFLSSIATLPRTFMKVGKNVLQGDLQKASNEAKSILSIGLRTPLDIASNEDYFGGEIYEPGSSDQLEDIMTYAAGQYVHPYISEGLKQAQGKQPTYQTISKMLELPFRFYKDKSIESGYYYQSKDEAMRGLASEDKAVLEKWLASKPKDLTYAQDATSSMAEALEKLSKPDLLRRESQIKIQTAQRNKQTLDPFYTLEPEQQLTALRLQTFYPGDKQKSDLTNANIEWLKPFWAARTAYFDELVAKGVMPKTENTKSFPTPPEMQAKLDAYYKLPYGTGQRSAFIKQNPDLVAYWDAKTDFTNAQREQLGLLPIEGGGGGRGGFAPYQRKAPSFKQQTKSGKFKKLADILKSSALSGKTQSVDDLDRILRSKRKKEEEPKTKK